jgi:rod shape-determining protein MreD
MSTMQPILSVLFAVVATAVPWGLPADATFILPLVVVMMVFCWRALPGATLSALAAMLLGLLTDIVSGGPLGFWALLTLIGASAGGYAKDFGAGPEVVTLWLFWACLAPGLALLGWLLASAYFLRWVDWWPIAVGAAASVVLFPVVVKGLRWIERGSFALGARANYRGRA